MALKYATHKHGSRADTARDPEKKCDQVSKIAALSKLLSQDFVIDLDEPAPAIPQQAAVAHEEEDVEFYDPTCDIVGPRAYLGLADPHSVGRHMTFHEAGDDEDAYFAELGMHITTRP